MTDQRPTESDSNIYAGDTDAELPRYQMAGYGRYSDFAPLTKGGSAVLQSCRDVTLGRIVVMKTLHPHLANNEYQQARFLREARVTAQLQHPGTVPVYDLGRTIEGRLYFTMKKLVGMTLREIFEKQIAGDKKALLQYNLERMIGVLIQTSNALSYAHAHGVVHRDVKPENIHIGAYGEVMLLDWGIAKVWNEEDDVSQQHEVLTDVNQRPGTPLYMAPEQVRGGGDEIDQRTDVYATGVVLYEALTLTEPLRGDKIDQTFQKIVNEKPVPPRQRAPDRKIPPPLADICMKALEKSPDDRFQSMSEMISALREYRRLAMESMGEGRGMGE
ncbi:serine/threonine-protein kinase [Pirellulales bacterium]|nr:serine/threonine-protein kinase [Pirellulales bacterium]